MLYVICYDIADDRRRRKVDRCLRDFGIRVQESVFEARLDTRRLSKLNNRLERRIDPALDSIRIYRLCGACAEVIELMGIGPMPEDAPDVRVV
jgi:CRISPR-associated protein Cas2